MFGFGLSDIFYYKKPLNGIIVYYIMTLQKPYEISLKEEQQKFRIVKQINGKKNHE